MRLAIDATPLLGSRTGVATFAAGALGALVRRPDMAVTGYALSWRGRSTLREVLPPGAASGWAVPAGPLLRIWGHTNLVPAEWIVDAEDGFDVVHGTNFVVPPSRRAARVVTVHDLTCVRFPEMCTPTTLRYPNLIRRAIRAGAFVHTPSAFVADEVCELLGADPRRVRAVHHGLGFPGDPEPTTVAGRETRGLPGDPEPTTGAGRETGGDAGGADEQVAARGRARAAALSAAPVGRYVLALGTVEPRKDLPLLVRAFDRVAASRPELGLIIAGPPAWGSGALDAARSSARHRDRIALAGYVDGSARAELLAGAAVFAFPSRYEGFGLPPLEAMASGVPVVATAAGAVPEVCGDAALIVALGDEDAFTDALALVLDGGAGGLVERGRRHAARYTWDRCAEGLAALYREASASA